MASLPQASRAPETSPAEALACLSGIALLSAMGTSIANIALPTLAFAFHSTFQQVQWVVLAYLLAATSMVVTVGKLGDVIGRRRLMLGGLLLFAIASTACAAAPSLMLLLAGRALQGVGAAIMMALALAIARDSAAQGQAGRSLGMLAAMSAAGTALGPVAGGLLIAAGGWRAIFLALALMAAASLLAARRYLPPDTSQDQRKLATFDRLGALLLFISVIAFALGMTAGRSFGADNIVLLCIATFAAAAFVIAELRASSPLLPVDSLRDAVVRSAILGNLAVSAVMMSTLIIGPFYLASVIGLAPPGIGWAMALGPALVAVGGVPAGQIADRFGSERSSLAGLGLIATGCTALGIAPHSTELAGYLIPIALITLGYALFQTANNLVVLNRASPSDGGAISGLLNLSRNLGLIAGASVMGAIFAAASGAADPAAASPDAVAAGMRASFASAAAMIAAICVLMATHRAPGGKQSGK